MVSNVLSQVIKKAKVGYISGFELGNGDCSISHMQFIEKCNLFIKKRKEMQFSDHTMIFCDVDVRQLGILRCILRCFETDSGLKNKLG